MGVANATLNGARATSARATIPAWGLWYADAHLEGEHKLSGAVELRIADLTLKGTVLSGGASKGRSSYRIVAGAGGWGNSIPKKGYVNGSGVKLRSVLGDAAREVGESLDLATINESESVGFSWTRDEGTASRLLELVASQAWYVGEDGVTRLGKRATKTLTAAVTHGPVDRARATVQIAAESIATILPGMVVDELEAVDVEHEVSGDGGLRSTIWGDIGSSSRRLGAYAKLFELLDPGRKFRGVHEYRITTQSAERLNLQPVRVSRGMPPLKRVHVRPGVPGAKAEHSLDGARVLVVFIDEDPARPAVIGFEDAESGGFLPIELAFDATTFVDIGLGALPAIRAGDLAGGVWPVAATQTKVRI